MPLFEYVCTACGHEFEELVFGGKEPTKCPKCGQAKIKRKLSVFGASVKDSHTPSCDGGSCSTGSCPTGSCPFS